MKKQILSSLVIVGIIGGSFAVFQGLMATKKPPEKKETESQSTLVEVVRATKQTVSFDVKTQGTVTPRTETTLYPEVSGEIVYVSDALVAGGFFQEGDLLLKIDPSNYEVALAVAEAQLARSEVSLMQEEALSAQALKDWIALGNEKEDATSLVLREPQLKEAKADIRSAKAAVKKAKRDLRKTEIRAPYEGMVRSRLSDLGQVVNQGSSLAEIFATDFVEIRLPLTAEDLQYLDLPHLHHPENSRELLTVTLSSRFGEMSGTWTGKITRTEGTIDPKTRVMYAVAKVEDPYGLKSEGIQVPLSVGMFVDATIVGRVYDDVVVLPRYSLRGKDQILVVNDKEELRRRDVDVLRTDSKLVFVGDGVEVDERICLTALEFVVEGMSVEAIEGDSGVAALDARGSMLSSL